MKNKQMKVKNPTLLVSSNGNVYDVQYDKNLGSFGYRKTDGKTSTLGNMSEESLIKLLKGEEII